MAHQKTERNPLFAGRWFDDDIILLCLRWYFRFKLSYRDLVAILAERGLSISHSTILRWVVHYADTCEKRWRRFERPVGGSWRVDKTFIKVRGQWMYLYRAVDGQGNTVEFFLSRTRGIAAAKAFFRKALKHHREPHSITLDGHRPSHSALRRMGMNGEFNFRGCGGVPRCRRGEPPGRCDRASIEARGGRNSNDKSADTPFATCHTVKSRNRVSRPGDCGAGRG